MWSSKKTVAPPTAIAGGSAQGRSSTAFSILQPIPVNASSSKEFGKGSNAEPRLGRLPASLHAHILSFLPVSDIPRYASTCKQLARLVKTTDKIWKVKCEVLGVQVDTVAQTDKQQEDATGSASTHGGRQRHRGTGSISSLKSMTNPTVAPLASGQRLPGAFAFEDDEDEDEFGAFSESMTNPARRDSKNGGRIAVLGKPPPSSASKKPNGTPNLMDLDAFDDFDFDSVPMPSNAKSPEKAKGAPRSGFFALPAVNVADVRRTSSISRTQAKPPSPWYEAYTEVHTQLMPYVRILRSASSSPAQQGGSTSAHLTPTQTLAFLFPSSHSPNSPVPGPLPLVDQATVLARLVLLLTPLIEPTADWAWIRRVLIGGGGVIDRWDGSCLSGFEGLERRATSSTTQPAGSLSGSDEKLVEEMRRVAGASWKVHTSMARSKVLSSPSSSRSRFRSTGSGKGTGISFTAGLGGWGGIGGSDGDDAGWELGRVWVEKREVFYESGSGGKWDSGENIV